MSLDKIKQKLAELNAQNTKQSTQKQEGLIWKPEAGKNLIRILPNKHGEDGFPFIELFFYYNQFGKTLLSPATFGETDPVIEYCNSLTEDRRLDKDEYSAAMSVKKSLLPKQRVYVPILVRGKEHEGVKFWGFGVKIYQQLLELMMDSDWGDISNVKTGRDITVTFTPAANENSYPSTQVSPKPNVSVATDDSVIVENIRNMTNLAKTFNKPSYDELSDLLKKYLEIPTKKTEPNAVNIKANAENVQAGFSSEPKSAPASAESVQPFVDELEALFAQKIG